MKNNQQCCTFKTSFWIKTSTLMRNLMNAGIQVSVVIKKKSFPKNALYFLYSVFMKGSSASGIHYLCLNIWHLHFHQPALWKRAFLHHGSCSTCGSGLFGWHEHKWSTWNHARNHCSASLLIFLKKRLTWQTFGTGMWLFKSQNLPTAPRQLFPLLSVLMA